LPILIFDGEIRPRINAAQYGSQVQIKCSKANSIENPSYLKNRNGIYRDDCIQRLLQTIDDERFFWLRNIMNPSLQSRI
jgi:hypothetical protein